MRYLLLTWMPTRQHAFAFLFLLAMLGVPLFSQDAFACTCGGPDMDMKSALDRGDALFSGPDVPLNVEAAFARGVGNADAVFAGKVVWTDEQSARLQVDKIWKGADASEITLLTGTVLFTNGVRLTTTCEVGFSVEQEYIVFAHRESQQMRASACSLTARLQEPAVRALDAVIPHRKVGVNTRPCRTEGQIRVLTVSSKDVAIPAVRVTLDGDRDGFGALTADDGRTEFSGLPPGEYRITAHLEGYAPRRSTVVLSANGCVETSFHLLPTSSP